MPALREHLTACAACRRVEADYRGVGERIRRLPSITPPADFRERVFAAIQADERRVSPAAIALSRAVTDPSLPVVRAMSARPRRRELHVGPRAALAAAALIGLTLAASLFLPGHASLGGIADSLSKLAGDHPGAPAATLAPLAADPGWHEAVRLGNTGGAAAAEGSFVAAKPYAIVYSCTGSGRLTMRYPSGSRAVSCASTIQRERIAGLQPSGASETVSVSVTTTGPVAWQLLAETQD